MPPRDNRTEGQGQRDAARARLEARQSRMHADQGGSRRNTARHVPEEDSASTGSERQARRPSPASLGQRAAEGGTYSSRRPEARNVTHPFVGTLTWLLPLRANPRALAVIVGAVVVALVLAVVLMVRGCSSEPAQVADQQVPQQRDPGTPTGQVSLPAGLEAELSSLLTQAAATSDDVTWIANHAADYAVDGEAVQYKLLKLAATEPQSVPFVRTFPEKYPASSADPTGGDPWQGGAPLLYQWDPRWGYTVYSSTTFALTGCCPTSLSMVYLGLTGKTDLSPYDMGQRAMHGGYETTFDGTDSSFLANEAPSLGLSCTAIGVNEGELAAALADGGLVVCNVGPGDFTQNGHFFVISGMNDDGTLIVNDPYSAERSAKPWEVGKVLGQTKALFAYRAA